jgi:hypothetical protein
MNPYKKMYVLCEEEYNRLKDSEAQCNKQQRDDSSRLTVPLHTADIVPVEQSIHKDLQTKKKYTCHVCNKEYSDKHDLRRHKVKEHRRTNQDLSQDTSEKQRSDKIIPHLPQSTTIKSNSSKNPLLKIKKSIARRRRDPFVVKIKKWLTIG